MVRRKHDIERCLTEYKQIEIDVKVFGMITEDFHFLMPEYLVYFS